DRGLPGRGRVRRRRPDGRRRGGPGGSGGQHLRRDGRQGSCVLLDSAQDHKRVGDGDTGPNTGGRGCYSPVPFLDQDTATWVLDNVLTQVVDELRPYRGVLYAGLMLTPDGPKVLEFNCR